MKHGKTFPATRATIKSATKVAYEAFPATRNSYGMVDQFQEKVQGGILAGTIGSMGYPMVNIDGKPRTIHRLMMMAFCGPPPVGMEVCHNNGVRHDNRLCNLRWATHTENLSDRKIHGTDNTGERNPRCKTSSKMAALVKDAIREGSASCAQIAVRLCVPIHLVKNIKSGKAWRHI